MNGPAHSAITIAIAGAALYACKSLGVPDEITRSTVGGCLMGLVMHPDLDQAESSKSPHMLPWWLYGKLIPHRNPLSHGPVIGTLGRVLYASLIIWIVLRILGIEWNVPWSAQMLYAFLGLCAVDMGHILADKFTKGKS